MFEKFADDTQKIIDASRAECLKFDGGSIGSEHLLLALVQDVDGIAARALATMGIYVDNVRREAEQIAAGSAVRSKGASSSVDDLWFTQTAMRAIHLAKDHCRAFGQTEVHPEHLLLAIIDLKDAAAIKILEELGANMTYLWRQVIRLMATQCCHTQKAPSLRTTLLRAIKELVSENEEAAHTLTDLSIKSRSAITRVADRSEIVHLVLVGYLPELLGTQVMFQRYLLEETLKNLIVRTGPLDQELTATIVSNSAQNLRSEVRTAIEYLWSHEYRLFDQVLDEAEHDVIGSVIEDLWWAQSEEIALHDLFDSALDDHRRKHILSLQKRRIEISQRITKLLSRLSETIQQCFVKRTISA